MRVPYLLPVVAITVLLSMPVFAQETEIENDVPVSAEATTSIVPGKATDVEASMDPQSAATTAAKPDRIYTDGMLSNPEPKAEDLGMASPGQKMTVDTEGDSAK